LRNVALTAPYGHCGAYPDLESVIRHHLDPGGSLVSYNAAATRMPNTNALTSDDAAVMQDQNLLGELASQSEIDRISLTDKEVSQIIDFLHCLTDPRSLNLLRDIPARVPSGLPISD
jgi:cytochrome c peroxidase